jgi:hypothetical protein
MSGESSSPTIELGELRLEVDELMRDNIVALKDSLLKIQLILTDIDARLKALE